MANSAPLDASMFGSTNTEIRSRYSRQLLRGLLDDGFVRIINHGIPAKTIEEAFQWNRRFFDLPLESKSAIAHAPGPDPQRGYSSLGSEKTSRVYAKLMGREVPENQRDMREHFDYGAPDDTEFPNIWPAESDLPGFKQFMTEFYRSCERVSFSILAALEDALEVPPGTFQVLCKPGNASEGRINRYPVIPLEEMQSADTTRISPHFDLGIITMLFSTDVGGLEFEDRRTAEKERFTPVEPGTQSEMIVSIAETMQRWTQDKLPASLHRVTIPPSLQHRTDGMVPERYSIVYLCKADRNASVGVLPEFSSGGEEKYKHMTALQYHMQRIATAY